MTKVARDEVVAWIAVHVLPYEAGARRWLARLRSDGLEADDIVQEAYARIATLDAVAHIGNGRAYFMMTVRNLAFEHLRRQKLIRIDAMAEIESLAILDDRPSAEDVLAGRQQLMLVKSLIEALPERCRAVFRLRKIEGLSQKQAADHLGITENVVEKQTAIGLKRVLRQLAERGLEDVIPPKRIVVRDKKGRHGDR